MDHSVNVLHFAEARASEIASLMSEVTSSEKAKRKAWFQNLPHHLRRRAASHNPKRVPKNLRVSNQSTTKPSSKGKKHKKTPKDLKVEYASRSKPGSTWLENHIWLAKRFKMQSLWGYMLPIKSNDRKLGATHIAAANRSMLQDLSYYCCIELTGIQENILHHLSMLTNSSGHTFASEMFLDGTKEGHTFLYHPDSYPYKAIGPVSFIWKPVFDEKTREYKIEISSSNSRQLWIWCHPSFHDELVQVLSNIFKFEETNASESKADRVDNQFTFNCKLNQVKNERHFCKEKTFVSEGIKMVLRKNTLVRHRLVGPMSLSILMQVLTQADVDVSSALDQQLTEKSAKKFKPEDSGLWWKSFYEREHLKLSHYRKGELLEKLRGPQSAYYVSPGSVIGLTVRDPRIEFRKEERDEDCAEETPNSSSDIGSFFTPEIADSALWQDDIRNEVTASKMSDQEINKERSNCIGLVELGVKEGRIPVLIIHQAGVNGFGSGWDLIAPLGWSLEFWRSFHRRGCTPAGLRDLRFVNLEAGLPSYPRSFPDTSAGQAYEEQTRLDALKEYHRRPKSKRPNFGTLGVSTPFFMCWKTLVRDWRKECGEYATLYDSLSGRTDEKEYYVLRQKELGQIGNICRRLTKVSCRCDAEKEMELVNDMDNVLSSINLQMDFNRSLIGLRIRCPNKGVPTPHSGIYLLSKEDLEEVQKNHHFNGPTEPCHKSSREQKKCLERPQVDTLISISSRKLIGYISEGGYSSLCGKGYGIGHCSSIAFMEVLKQCLEAHLRPMVLFREQHCFKYRVANVEVIDY